MASLFESLGINDEEQQAAPVKPEKTGVLRTMGDQVLSLGQGVVGGVKMLSDLAGPDNAVSQTLGEANTSMQGMFSASRAEEMKNRQALIDAADNGDSTLNQITTRLGGIAEAPIQTVMQAVGSMAPNIAAALATGGVSAGPGLVALAARFGVPAALGVGMGVGSVKGQNYEAVFNKAKQEGLSDDEAVSLGIKASEYSAQNAPQQALGGAFGMLDSLTGAERMITGMTRKAGAEVAAKPAQGLMRRTVLGAAEEAPAEGLQGAQGQYAQNEALNNAGFTTNPWAGVAGAGINDAVVGAMVGGPMGALHNPARQAPFITPQQAEADAIRATELVPEAGAMTRAANVGTEAKARAVESAPPITPEDVFAQELAATQDDIRQSNTLQKMRDSASPTLGVTTDEFLAALSVAGDASASTDLRRLALDNIQGAMEHFKTGANLVPDVPQAPGTELATLNERATGMAEVNPAPEFDPNTLDGQTRFVDELGSQRAIGGPRALTYDDPAPDAPPPSRQAVPQLQAGDIQNKLGKPFTNLFAAKNVSHEAGPGYAPVKLGENAFVVRKVDAEQNQAPARVEQANAAIENVAIEQEGREGYEKPFEIDAKALMALFEKENGTTLAWNSDKLNAVRGGAKSTGNIEAAINARGDIGINDGRHRIAVAAERGERVKVFASEDDGPAIMAKLAAPEPVTQPAQQEPAAAESVAPTAPAPEQADSQHIGRNNKPLSEGGKPFKTKDEASEARKLQPMLRVVKSPTGKGFSLAPKTEAQLAAQDKAAKRLSLARTGKAGVPTAAHEFIAGEGGMDSSTRTEFSFGSNPRVGNRTLFAGARGGMSIEAATEKLIEARYLPAGSSHSDTVALINRSFTQPQYTVDGTEVMAEAAHATRFEDHLAAQQEAAQNDNFDPFAPLTEQEYTAADMAGTGYAQASAEIQQEVAALSAQLDAMGIDAEEIRMDIATQNSQATNQEYHELTKAAITNAINEQAAVPRGRGDTGQNDGEQGQPAPDREGQEAGLTAPSRAEILAQQERTDNAQALDDRAQIDAEASRQTLTRQSAPEQRTDTSGDMFAVEKAQAVIDKRNAGVEKAKDPNQAGMFDEPAQEDADELSQPIDQLRKIARDDDHPGSQEARSELARHGLGYGHGNSDHLIIGSMKPPSEEWMQVQNFRQRGVYELAASELKRFLKLAKARSLDAFEGQAISDRDSTISKWLAESKPTESANQATAILDAANITGKERIEALKDVKKGDITPEELEAAYPAKEREAKESAESAPIRIGDQLKPKDGFTYTVVDVDGNIVDAERVIESGGGVTRIAGISMSAVDAIEARKAAYPANESDGKAAESKPSTEATKPPKIEDSGQVLEGARKLYAKNYAAKLDEGTGMDTATVPLSKSWPEPDYQRLIDEGADPWAVAMTRAMRDEVPTKPSSWKLKGWVQKVETLRDMTSKVMSGEMTQEKFKTTGGQFNLADWFNKIDLYEAVGHSKSLKTLKFSMGEYGMYGGQTFKPAKKLWTINMPGAASTSTWASGNWGADLVVADTKAEAIEKFKAWSEAQGEKVPTEAKATSFDIYSYRSKPGITIVGKRINSTKSIDLKEFATVKEAREYKAANQTELEALLAKAKFEPSERGESNAPRVGADHRSGADVTSEQFRETFGFRGEQFGASMPQSERQANMNQAYDALMDLAGVVGIPPKALSLNGELGLAFGARGTGGKNPAAAHYERDTTGAVTPNRVVINLTRKNGAGSLAHEWFHAVDNYFARMRGEKAGMLTESHASLGEGVRPEMVAAFKQLMAAINVSGIRERSKQLDKKRVKDYWSTGLEMAARSFESYVIAKLQDNNGSNDYLANIVPESLYAMQSSYPYPVMGEMPAIRAAFDNFFGVVQTKETEQGVAMFATGSATTGSTILEVEQALSQFTDGMKNAPLGKVVQTTADLPFPAPSDAKGAYWKGSIYLVAGNIGSAQDARDVIAHEMIGHYGLRGFFGSALAGVLDQIHSANPRVRIAAGQWTRDNQALISEWQTKYGMTDAQVKARSIEEALAGLAEKGMILKGLNRLAAALQTLLRKMGASKWADSLEAKTDAEALLALKKAEMFVRKGVTIDSKIPDAIYPLFSRTPISKAVQSTQDALKNATVTGYAKYATDRLNETFSHPGGMSLWDKTVGSMYHLAERNPPFKRVFDAAQAFIQDVSFYATEAADLAPKILPKLDTWKDMLKTPVSAADNKAISAPILQGTLSWARDESGKPVLLDELEATYGKLSDEAKAQMLLKKRIVTEDQLKRWKASPLDIYEGAVRNRFNTAFLTAGVVWKDAELQSMFNLNPAQISLYREFRAATDASLDNLAKADLLRFGGKDVAHLADMVMDAATVDDAALLLRDYLHSQHDLMPERVDDLTAAAGGMIERADKVNKLKAQGYAPLSRFGRYSVDVVVDGKREYFGLFESKAASNMMALKMKQEYGAASVAQGTMSQKEFELFQGITPESLELFGNMLGLDSTGNEAQDQAFQTYLKLTKTNRSAMKRMIHRKGTAGFSEDIGRVLAAFVYSNARQTSAALHMGELGDSVQAIPKGQGELKDAAVELSDYIKKPREEAQALRGLLFAQYLGGSVASAFVNFTQPLTVSFPYLSMYGGAKQSGAALAKAMHDQRAGVKLEDGLRQALHQAEEEGTVSPQSVHELMAQAQGRSTLNSGDGTAAGDALAGAKNNLAKLAIGWGKLFGLAEQINRRSTFIAAYRIAVAQNIANPAAFAIKAVNETQFISNKANKAKFARGAIGATLMTFKSYSTNYLELLHRMATQNGPEGKKAAALMLGMLFLMAGAGGLPFDDDLEDVADGFAQLLGYNFSSKKAKQEFLEGLFGKTMGDFIDKGITGLPGSPIDVSGRMSMGNLIPGTGLLLQKRDHGRDWMEFAGPAGDLATRAFTGAGGMLSGAVHGDSAEFLSGAKAIAPKAVSNAEKGLDMASTGNYNDDKGYKVLAITPFEAAMKAVGFQPHSVAEVQQSNYLHQRAKDFYVQHAQDVNARWAKGIYENDPGQVASARAMVQSWNDNNPEQLIRANLPAILKRVQQMRKDKSQRIADTAPKAMRAQMKQEVAQDRAAM